MYQIIVLSSQEIKAEFPSETPAEVSRMLRIRNCNSISLGSRRDSSSSSSHVNHSSPRLLRRRIMKISISNHDSLGRSRRRSFHCTDCTIYAWLLRCRAAPRGAFTRFSLVFWLIRSLALYKLLNVLALLFRDLFFRELLLPSSSAPVVSLVALWIVKKFETGIWAAERGAKRERKKIKFIGNSWRSVYKWNGFDGWKWFFLCVPAPIFIASYSISCSGLLLGALSFSLLFFFGEITFFKKWNNDILGRVSCSSHQLFASFCRSIEWKKCNLAKSFSVCLLSIFTRSGGARERGLEAIFLRGSRMQSGTQSGGMLDEDPPMSRRITFSSANLHSPPTMSCICISFHGICFRSLHLHSNKSERKLGWLRSRSHPQFFLFPIRVLRMHANCFCTKGKEKWSEARWQGKDFYAVWISIIKSQGKYLWEANISLSKTIELHSFPRRHRRMHKLPRVCDERLSARLH